MLTRIIQCGMFKRSWIICMKNCEENFLKWLKHDKFEFLIWQCNILISSADMFHASLNVCTWHKLHSAGHVLHDVVENVILVHQHCTELKYLVGNSHLKNAYFYSKTQNRKNNIKCKTQQNVTTYTLIWQIPSIYHLPTETKTMSKNPQNVMYTNALFIYHIHQINDYSITRDRWEDSLWSFLQTVSNLQDNLW